MSTADPFLDLFALPSNDEWQQFGFLPTPNTSAAHVADSVVLLPSADPENTREDAVNEDARKRQQFQPTKLALLQLADWEEEGAYDEDPPSCIHYAIEWKLTVNNRIVSKDTEQDLVLAPAPYWQTFLRPKLEKRLRRKVSHNRSMRCDDTNVVVSVTERSERDLTKQFEGIDIDWSVVEKQLLAWGELFRAGKKLRVDLSFNYLETGQQSASSSRKGDKRGYSSTTQQMLTERAAQLDAEEEASGKPSIWREVYNLMRCPGPPCHLGPHCWRDPVSKKHYKLKTHHLKSLIRYVEQGCILRTHDNVPEDIRQQLYAEEQQKLERKPTAAAMSPPSMPPINITNVLPGHSHQASLPASQVGTPASTHLSNPIPADCLDIPGLRDVAVRKYSDWQQSKVHDEVLKVEFRKARDTILTEGPDLEQVYEDQDPDFLISKGVKRGIARRFVGDIEQWVSAIVM